MATWPANAETDWNTKMLAYLAIGHDTDGTHNQEDWTPATYAGGETATLPNGLIMKMGHSANPSGDSPSGNVTITFDVAFPTNVVSVVATMRNNTSTGTYMFYFTDNPSTTGFVFRYKEYSGTHSLDGFDWIAIGY